MYLPVRVCVCLIRLHLHEDVFASKRTLSYAFTRKQRKRKPETHRFENVFKSGYLG